MALGWQQLLIVLILVLVLFGGRGRISALMGDMAKGIKSFRKGLADDEAEAKSSEKKDEVSHDTPAPGTTATATETSKKTEA